MHAGRQRPTAIHLQSALESEAINGAPKLCARAQADHRATVRNYMHHIEAARGATPALPAT
eukprot:3576347-Lingulodinium_polyedra.AAC.1